MSNASPQADEVAVATEQLWRVYAAINEWIRFSDTKAGALLALNGVLVASAVGPAKDAWSYLVVHRFLLFLLVLCGVCLFASAFYCLECIRPKLKIERASGDSLIFFEHIANHSNAGSYGTAARALGRQTESYDEISKQVWAVARVARTKHRQIQWSVWWLIWGLVLCAVDIVAYILTA